MLDLGLPALGPETYSVYADESKPDGSCPWLIIGLLVLPDSRRDRALSDLRAAREKNSYPSEVHFVEIRNHSRSPYGAKTRVAIDWVRRIVHDRSKTFNMHIVAIKGALLDHKRFGNDADDNIYARFFKSALSYALKASIPSAPRRVSRIFHDESHLERHEYFPWSAIRRLSAEDGIQFNCDQVEFISSNHEKPGHGVPWAAEFIQAVDVWMGLFRQVLTMSSGNKHRLELVEHGDEFIRVLNDPSHKCRPLLGRVCEFDHQARCSVGFFPDDRIRGSEMPDVTGTEALRYFYRGERLAYFADAQQSLFDP